jgi:hypothetical protein
LNFRCPLHFSSSQFVYHVTLFLPSIRQRRIGGAATTHNSLNNLQTPALNIGFVIARFSFSFFLIFLRVKNQVIRNFENLVFYFTNLKTKNTFLRFRFFDAQFNNIFPRKIYFCCSFFCVCIFCLKNFFCKRLILLAARNLNKIHRILQSPKFSTFRNQNFRKQPLKFCSFLTPNFPDYVL